MKNNIYNISILADFHGFIAKKYAKEYLDNPLGLADVLFLMPSSRAVSSLKNAFLQVFELKPMILPQIKAIADFDEDELLLKVDDFSQILPAMSKEDRMFYFIKLIMAKQGVNLNQAYQLALELSSMFDEAANLGLDFNELQSIIPENFSSHKQEMFEFLQIITQSWPHILAEEGKQDVVLRQQEVLDVVCNNLVKINQKIVVCGVSAPFVGIKNLLDKIKNENNSEIYFYGIDTTLSDEEWKSISDMHPSFENKKMLDYLDIKRDDLINVFVDENKEAFISELMRPAMFSEKWQNIKPELKSFFENIDVIEAENLSIEALIIAIIIRKNIEEDKEICLITPDRNLSRRVCSELLRFGLEVDDSAGRPLGSTAVGTFMRLVLKNVINKCDVVSFLAMVKHPYFNNKDFVKEYEKIVLRQKKINQDLSNIADDIKAKITMPAKASLIEMLKAHIKLCQDLCDKLFVKEEGRVVTKLFANILEKAELIDEVSIEEYVEYFDTLLSGVMVRKTYNTHPKIKILGPIEARFNKFDVAIIGSCNEGMWPLNNNGNPWLSDSMKKELGMHPHSYKMGINAFDFAAALGSKNVYITRAIKTDGTPQVKSRFLLKIEALAKLLGYEDDKKSEYIYKKLADIINKPSEFINILPPQPKPPVDARPTEISASQIEVLIKDPYSIYAKKILSLYPLDDLNQELEAKDYGTLIHKILELFYKKYDAHFPLNAKEELQQIGNQIFAENGLRQEVLIFWQAKLNKIIDWLVEVEHQYSIDIKKRHNEVSAAIDFGTFKLKAKADRIDELVNGDINVLDYKTGSIKTRSQMDAGYAPQLPSEGLIFASHFNCDIHSLIYWQLGKKEAVFEKDIDELLLKAKEQIVMLFNAYNDKEMPYHSCPDANNMLKYNDYEHLARLKEWSVKGDGDE